MRQLCARTPEGSFTKKTLHEILSQFARSHKINMKMFFMVMRVVISPQKVRLGESEEGVVDREGKEGCRA